MFVGFESTDPKCEMKVPQAEYIYFHKVEAELISNPSSMVLRSSPTIRIVHVSLHYSLDRVCDPRMSIGQLREREPVIPRTPCQDKSYRYHQVICNPHDVADIA